MINKIDLKASDIAIMNPLLKKVEKTIAEAIKIPSIIVDDSSPQQREANHIIEHLEKEFPEILLTIKLPGVILQFLFPEEELLISIIFLYDKTHNTRHIKLELVKLSSEI